MRDVDVSVGVCDDKLGAHPRDSCRTLMSAPTSSLIERPVAMYSGNRDASSRSEVGISVIIYSTDPYLYNVVATPAMYTTEILALWITVGFHLNVKMREYIYA